MKFALALIAALAIIGSAAAAERRLLQEVSLVTSEKQGDKTIYTVDWRAVEGRYDDIKANCGDEIVFKWDGATNNVGVAKDGGDCDSVSNVTEPSTSGEATFVLDSNLYPIVEHGEVYFTSTVGDNCAKGQLIEAYVDCSAEIASKNAAAPASGAAAAVAAAVGAAALMLMA